jgi:hypothetical protein
MKNWESRIRGTMQWIRGAEWWHFWNPGSGFPGGVIACALIYFVIMLCWLIVVVVRHAA